MLTPERLREIKERCERATPGPWEVEGRGGAHMNGARDYYIVVRGGDIRNASLWTLEDAEFAAHAREDVPALVAEVERLWRILSERGIPIDAE